MEEEGREGVLSYCLFIRLLIRFFFFFLDNSSKIDLEKSYRVFISIN